MKNTVIKVLNKEHGKKVINWFKSQGVKKHVINGYIGDITEEDGDYYIYYGIIDGVFNNYNKQEVDRKKATIITLPETERTQLDACNDIYKPGMEVETCCGTIGVIDNTPFRFGLLDKRVYANDGDICLYDTDDASYAKIIKTEEKMETQKLSRKGLKEIHSVACGNWKLVLEKHGTRNPLEDYVELTQEEVNEMFKACTKDQLPIVSKYLKQDDGSVDISKVTYNENGTLLNDKYIVRHNAFTSITNGFWLNPDYNWEVKMISDTPFLVPTKK